MPGRRPLSTYHITAVVHLSGPPWMMRKKFDIRAASLDHAMDRVQREERVNAIVGAVRVEGGPRKR